MNPLHCSDDLLHEAVYKFLCMGPDYQGHIYVSNGRRWKAAKTETRAAFAERFPRGMDKQPNKKGKK